MKRAILLLALLWPSVSLSQYENVTGSDLVNWCEEPSTVYCAGYLLGVVDSLNVHHEFCLPESVTVDKMGSVFLKWAATKPELLNKKASLLVEEAFEETWPCKP